MTLADHQATGRHTLNELGTSVWVGEEPRLERPLAEDLRADVVVVGGGFAGLSAAFHLKEAAPGLDILLLEARYCGYGASGRTQGIPAPHAPDASGKLKEALGPVGLRRFVRQQIEVFDAYEKFILTSAIDCRFKRTDVAWIVSPEASIEVADLTRQYEEADFPFSAMSQRQTREISSFPAATAIHFGPSVRAAFDPYKFVRGLRERIIDMGVRVFEGSPVESIESSAKVVASCASGRVIADYMVLATNAYSDLLVPARGLQKPLRLWCLVTDPLEDSHIRALGWPEQFSLIVNIHPGYLFISARMLEDRRMLFAPASENRLCPTREDTHALMLSRFPALKNVRIQHAYEALLDMSPSHLPVVASLKQAENIIVSLGFSGHGIIQTFLSGRMVAGMIVGGSAHDEQVEEMRQVYRTVNNDLLAKLV